MNRAAMPADVKTVTVPLILAAEAVDAGKRLDRFLQERLPQYSRARLQAWIRAGRVKMNDSAGKPSQALRGGERIQVEPAEPPPLAAFAEDLPLEILYEDADVIALNKPAGMVVHAGAGHWSGTVVNALLHRFAQLSGVGGGLRPGIVHRLDRDTSGVLLVARVDAAHRALAAQFAGRSVEKVYLALVHGRLKQDRGRIDQPIRRDPVRRTRMTARPGRAGRSALTEYSVLRRWERFTLLEVRIATGRTHQIRVHLSGVGHPVVGDRLYGAPARVEGLPALDRFFLHAHRVRFASPSTGRQVTVEAPLPAELQRWIEGL